MYDYFLILKGTNKKLAILEFETLWSLYYDEKIILEEVQNIFFKFSSNIFLEDNDVILKRLTYTNYIGKIFFEAETFEDYLREIIKLDLKSYDEKSFAVRIKKSKKSIKMNLMEKEIAKPIWEKMQKPSINLDNPNVEFNFMIIDNMLKYFFVLKIYENKKEYLERMPKLRPIAMPYTLKSDMARVVVNFLALKNGLVLDPFCGIGGILLEAQEMGFDVLGNDISWNDLKYFKENFKYYFPRANYMRTLADSKTQFLKENSVDGLVTDIPYGKSSRKLGTDLYEEFLKSAKIYLKKEARIVVIYANFVEFKDIALKYFKKIDEIDQYINKSMTRHILILINDK